MNYKKTKTSAALSQSNTMPQNRQAITAAAKHTKGKLILGSSARQNVLQGTPEIRDPLYSPENLFMPNSRIMQNIWIRHYDITHPYLGNLIDLHAYFPISDFDCQGIKDPGVLQFYDQIKEQCQFYEWMLGSSREYELMGEAFTYFPFDSKNGVFKSGIVLNTDLLEVYPYDDDTGRKFIVSMKISQQFKDLYKKSLNDPRFTRVWEKVHPTIRYCTEHGKPIPFHVENIYGLQRLAHPYDTRGTSQCIRVLKDLLYEDKLREAQMAVADGHITPIQLWKIGNMAAGYSATADEIDSWNQLIAEGEHQNFFRIVAPDIVTYESISPTNGLLDITPEINNIQDRVLTALYTSKAMISGDSPTYSGSVVAYKILERRYLNKQVKMANIIKDIYRKIAKVHGIVKRSEAEVRNRIYVKRDDYVIPDLGWHDDFTFAKDQVRIEYLTNLAAAHKVSYKTVVGLLGLDYDKELIQIKEEMKTVLPDQTYDAKIQKVIELLDGKKPSSVSNIPLGDKADGGFSKAPEAPKSGGGSPAKNPSDSNMTLRQPPGGENFNI